MAIRITSVQSNNNAATGLSVTWNDGQFVMLIADKGIVSCGIVDLNIIEKFSFAFAIAHGTPEKPLITAEDLLSANVSEVSSKAKEYGVRPGMTGEEALKRLS